MAEDNCVNAWWPKHVLSQQERKGTPVISSSPPTASRSKPNSTITPPTSTEVFLVKELIDEPKSTTDWDRVKILSRSWDHNESNEALLELLPLKTSTGNEKSRFAIPPSTFSFFFGVMKSLRLLENPSREAMNSSISLMSQETTRGRIEDLERQEKVYNILHHVFHRNRRI